MAESTHGTTYIWGVDATSPTESQITNIELAKSDEQEAYIKNGVGNRIGVRSDDQTDAIDITLHISGSFTRPAISSALTLVGGTWAGIYRIKGETETGANENWREFKIRAEKCEYFAAS